MKKQSDEDIRDSIIGLGENSIRKNYYPQLKKKVIEVEELNKTLEGKVNLRTQELNKAVIEQKKTNEKLQQTLDELKLTQKSLIESEKMAALGELVAGVAHEINTPIGLGVTGITHFLEMTKEIKSLYNKDNLGQDDFENYLEVSNSLANSININLIRAADLVKNFKQIAVDQTNEEKRQFNIYEYLDTILSSIHNITKKTQLSIKSQCDNTLSIKSFPGVYSQIITNLVINSIMHGYEKNQEGNIQINVEKKEDHIKITYKDDGKGISKENLTKIFNPFFTTNRKHGGTGLGLNILYNLVTNNLNGKITCESVENEGVTFTFTDTNL